MSKQWDPYRRPAPEPNSRTERISPPRCERAAPDATRAYPRYDEVYVEGDRSDRAYSQRDYPDYRVSGDSRAYDDHYETQYGYDDSSLGRSNVGPERVRKPAPIDVPKYIGGAVAVALVAALAAWLLTSAINWVYRSVGSDDAFNAQRSVGLTIWGGVLGAILAAALLVALIYIAPRPGVFFGVVSGLGLLAVTLAPILSTAGQTWQAMLATVIVNGVLGMVVISLTYTVGRATARVAF